VIGLIGCEGILLAFNSGFPTVSYTGFPTVFPSGFPDVYDRGFESLEK